MKLHQLTIENIASIEKAVIDFNDAPLANERLFLITGETGSGKSTIIDCLCLALYGNTPRMKAARNAVYEIAHNNGAKKEEQRTNNPRQLMRRGSVKASVELTFENDQGVPYVATWKVHRANGKIDGRLSSVSRELRTADGVTPASHFSKFEDIDGEIIKIVGLDMEQFFRTVVLAQGKFAEFLNSNDKAKSDLLEKMTGTGIYTQLGKKIYTVYKEKVGKCKILSGQMENIHLLNEEEKAKIIDEMGQLAEQQKAVDEQLKQATAMLQWLNDKHRLDKDMATNTQLLNETLAKTSDSAHQAEQALVKDWDATTEARQYLKDYRKAQQRIKELEGQKAILQDEFDLLCAGLRATVDDIDNQQKKVDEMGQAIAGEAPNKAMYDAIGEIVTLLGQWGDKKKNIEDYQNDLRKDEQRLPEMQKAVKEAQDNAKQLEDGVKELKERQSEFNITEISDKKDVLGQARQALETLKDKHNAITQAETALSNLKDKQAEDKTRLEQANATIDGKRVRMEELSKNVQRVTDWNALLEQAQRSLSKGDTCPVCGNTITTVLAPKAESELEELRKQLKEAEDDLRETSAMIQATEKVIGNNEKVINEAVQDLQMKIKDRAAHWQATQSLLIKCAKETNEMADNALADALIGDLNVEISQLNDKLAQADKLNKGIQEAQKRLDSAKQAQYTAEIQLKTIEESIKHQRQVIESSKRDFQALSDQLDGLLVMKDWKERADEEFITQLQTAADKYNDMVDARQRLSQLLEVRRAAIPAMLKQKESIKIFTDKGDTASQVPDGLEDRWRGLAGSYLQWQTQLNGEEKNAASSKLALDKYHDLNTAMTRERLEELTGRTQEEIDGIRKAHRTLNDSIIGIQGAIKTLTLQLNELNDKKPVFAEQNVERLEAFIGEQQETANVLTTQIADKKASLNEDEKKAVLMQDKMAALEQAEKECKRWEQLNKMLGDSEGTTFRNIAQSYILGDLLAHANGYLRQFNNRYALEAYPGTLTILARDLIQGDLTSVNTLSGGESFMVSLALALALSNMSGKMFSVDTIFIDEGFGSLSPVYLDNVMETLNRLYDMGGRRVGIISHVEMLKERVATQIKVFRSPDNNTVSMVEVTG